MSSELWEIEKVRLRPKRRPGALTHRPRWGIVPAGVVKNQVSIMCVAPAGSKIFRLKAQPSQNPKHLGSAKAPAKRPVTCLCVVSWSLSLITGAPASNPSAQTHPRVDAPNKTAFAKCKAPAKVWDLTGARFAIAPIGSWLIRGLAGQHSQRTKTPR